MPYEPPSGGGSRRRTGGPQGPERSEGPCGGRCGAPPKRGGGARMRWILCIVLLVAAVACKRTADGEKSRFQAGRDRLEAIATKNPAMKADIQAKLAEFDKAYKAADGKSGDDQIAALSALTDRMAAYEKAIAPAPAAAPDASAASKLGSKLATPASQPASAPSKLGAPASQPASAPS